LFSDSDVIEDINAWPSTLVSWQGCSFPGRAGQLTAWTVPHVGPFVLPKDATEWLTVAGIPVMFFSGQTCAVLDARDGALLRFSLQGSSSDSTNEPIVDRRWMSIVQEELGTPSGVLPVDDTEIDPALSDTATVDCIKFCIEHGILDDLRKCLAKAKEQFSSVVAIKAELDQFPSDEYEEEGHVHIRIEVAVDQDTAFQDYDIYTGWMLDAIDDAQLRFLLPTVSRVDTSK
jgi:hypothetical protein